MLALEPRIMFDGAMAGDAVDAVDAALPEENASLQNTAVNDQEHAEKESSRNEVVIVDGSITDYQSIISSIGSAAEVFILGENSTIDDIANLLGDRSGIDAVHIFTHGSTGTLLIGDHLYDENNISEYADALAEIGGSLTETGDILLYGCNIAATGDGQSFLSQFAALTSADIAASDDVTGNLIMGGDWELEYESGSIETDEKEIREFQGTLVSFSSITEDIADGDNDGNAVGTSPGIAVTAVVNTNGTWQFSTNGGASFSNFGSPGNNNARLLDDSHLIRFRPNADFNGSVNLTFKTWDKTVGSQGNTFDTRGNSSFGSSTTQSITVTAVNDAPRVNGTATVNEDTAGSFSNFIRPGPTLTNENSQTMTISSVSNTNTGLFSTQPAIDNDGDLTFTPVANNFGTSVVTFTAVDNGATGGDNVNRIDNGTFTITVTSVNDPPSGTFRGAVNPPPTITEDQGQQTISNFIENFNIGDGNTFETAAGETISSFVVTRTTNASTAMFTADPAIDTSGNLTYTPRANANGAATFSVEMRDDGSNSSPNVNRTTIGTFTITITALNDAPTLRTPPNGLTARINDSATGTTVSAMVVGFNAQGAQLRDIDLTPPATNGLGNMGNDVFAGEHVAVIDASDVATDGTNPAGHWEFDIGSGFFEPSPAISATNALLLDATSKVRYVRGGNETGDVTITFRAWDQTVGNDGDRINANTNNGGTNTLSSETAVATATLEAGGAVNDAPVLNTSGQSLINVQSGGTFPSKANFAAIDEDAALTASDNEQKIREWLNEDTVIDQESFADGGVTGVAIVNTDDTTKGTWQFSTDGGTTFTNFAVTGTEDNSLLLDGSSDNQRVRFAPAKHFNGTVTLQYRAWDQTQGNTSTGTTARVFDTNNAGANPAAPGGASAFSTGIISKTITVNPINDAPVLRNDAFTIAQSINEDSTAEIVVPNFAVPFSGAQAAAHNSAAARESNDTITFVVANTGGTSNSLFASAPTIDASGTLRYTLAPNTNTVDGGPAQFTVTFSDNGSDSGDNENDGTKTVNDATILNPTFTNVSTPAFTITVASVNDAPVLIDFSPDLEQNEDATAGTTINALLGSNNVRETNDVVTPGNVNDNTAFEAIAITNTAITNGTLQFKRSGGSFQNVGTVSAAQSLLLGPSDELRFVQTNTHFFGSGGTFNFRAWDQTTTAAGSAGTKVSTAAQNGSNVTSEFSIREETATVTINAVNDKPTTTIDTTFVDVPINETDSDTTVTIALFTPPLSGASNAVDVSARESSDTFTFTVINDGSQTPNTLFTGGGAPVINNATGDLTFTLKANANTEDGGPARFNVTLEDSGSDVDPNENDATIPSPAFSITVPSVNDAPTLNNVSFEVSKNEDVTGATTIATLIGNSGITEPEDQVTPGKTTDNTVIKAIAVTGTNVTNGTLQFSTNGGSSFTNIDAATNNAANSLLLDANDILKFVPTDVDFFGSGGTFTFRAWDQSTTASGQSGNRVSTTANGGITEFSSDQRTANITVLLVNDPPTATLDTSNAGLTVLEDAGAQTINGFATNLDDRGGALETGQTLSFALAHQSGTGTNLFSVQPALTVDASDPTIANLTFTPAANANTGGAGAAVFRVTISDDGGTLRSGDDDTILGNIQFAVTSQNDAPILNDTTVILNANEDTPPNASTTTTGTLVSALVTDGSVLETADNVTPGTTSDNTVIEAIAITGTTVSNGKLQFSTDGTNFTDVGTVSAGAALLLDDADKIRFVPDTNFHGTAGSFTYRAWDQTSTAASSAGTKVSTTTNGGTSEFSSFEETASVTITSVNDNPDATFNTGAGGLTVNEDAGAQTINGFVTATDVGDGGLLESAETISYVVTNNLNSLFAVQPAIANNGTLTFTPADNANGSASITVDVRDSAGGNTVKSNAFTITVNAVNDEPSQTLRSVPAVLEDAGQQSIANFVAATTKGGGSDENSQTLSFALSNTNSSLFSVQPALAADGTGALTYTPAPNQFGISTVTSTLTDSGSGVAPNDN
ncbi:DUF4347 domain-containing protein, partial [Rhodospirillales bacterium]|nr:DUF4347 domain-containing protein [Rhodospirillales bacterium]